MNTAAQCPSNIGFETGDFSGWECFAGKIDTSGNINVFVTPPIPNRHQIIPNTYPQTLDIYGQFPINCPNGSNYSIRLGNDDVNSEAERVSYTFTIPSNVDNYSIIYDYAVVLENPDHALYQQPRFTAKVFDVSSNAYIDCSSFDYAASSNLPGFKLSNTKSNVYYKPWTSVTIKLAGFAGRTLRLEFTTNDCTVGGHFGYAYLDVNENCSSPVGGNVFCNGEKSIRLTAPYGYQSYDWYNANFSQLLGTSRTLFFQPIPAPNTVYAVIITPYVGSGCLDTLYTTIQTSPAPYNFNVVSPIQACNPGIVNLQSSYITAGSTTGLTYSYFLDSTQDNYASTPKSITASGLFYITAANSDGCIDTKPINVVFYNPPVITVTDPPPAYSPNKVNLEGPSVVTGNIIGLTISYWKDTLATISLPNPTAVGIAGTYYIEATDVIGCKVIEPVKVVIIIPAPPNAFSPNNDGVNDVWIIPGIEAYPQCRVDIYSRSGQLVFHSIGYNNPWDGKINSKPLPFGTYYYVIKLDNAHAPTEGSITIIR